MRRALLAASLFVGVWGCNKDHGDGPGVSGEAAQVAPISEAPPGGSDSTATAHVPEGGDEGATWTGAYKSVAGEVYVPPDWKIRWKAVEGTAGIGEGALTFTVEQGTGAVRGALEGPLGPASLTGLAYEGRVTAMILRRTPSDHGFAGTLVGSLGRDRGEGTMSLSLAEGGAVRSATFVVSSGGGSPPAH